MTEQRRILASACLADASARLIQTRPTASPTYQPTLSLQTGPNLRARWPRTCATTPRRGFGPLRPCVDSRGVRRDS